MTNFSAEQAEEVTAELANLRSSVEELQGLVSPNNASEAESIRTSIFASLESIADTLGILPEFSARCGRTGGTGGLPPPPDPDC